MERLSVIDIARRAMQGIGLPAPDSLLTSATDLAPQIVSLMHEVAEIIIRRNRAGWQTLRREGYILTAASVNQGDIFTLFPDFRSFVNGTLYNSTRRFRLYGPASPQQWRAASNGYVSVPETRMWRLSEDQLQIFGQTTANERIDFEYHSRYWLKLATSPDRTETVSANNNICLLDGDCMIAGLQWKWLQANGLDSAEKHAAFEELLEAAIGADGSKDIVSLNSPISRANIDPTYPFDIVVET